MVRGDIHVAFIGRDGPLLQVDRILGQVYHRVLVQGRQRHGFALSGLPLHADQRRAPVKAAEPEVLSIEGKKDRQHWLRLCQRLKMRPIVLRQVDAAARPYGHHLVLRRMRRQAGRATDHASARNGTPLLTIIGGVVQARAGHTRIRRGIEYIHRIGLVARRQEMEVRFSRQPQVFPGLPLVSALDEAKRVFQRCPRGRMTTAIKELTVTAKPM